MKKHPDWFLTLDLHVSRLQLHFFTCHGFEVSAQLKKRTLVIHLRKNIDMQRATLAADVQEIVKPRRDVPGEKRMRCVFRRRHTANARSSRDYPGAAYRACARVVWGVHARARAMLLYFVGRARCRARGPCHWLLLVSYSGAMYARLFLDAALARCCISFSREKKEGLSQREKKGESRICTRARGRAC